MGAQQNIQRPLGSRHVAIRIGIHALGWANGTERSMGRRLAAEITQRHAG